MRSCNCGEALSASVQRKAIEARTPKKARVVVLLFIDAELASGRGSWQQLFRKSLRRFVGLFGFRLPQMERVGEHDVAEDFVRTDIGDVDRGIKLKIAGEIAGKTDGR